MKIYLAYLLLITGSIWITTPTKTVAKPQASTPVKESPTNKTISPTAALERLIVAEKLDASWFTPEFLKAVDKNSNVSGVQIQRDIMMKLGRFRYGKYKSVQSIGGNKYRIIFDRSEPDAVIAQFRIDASGRIAEIGIAEKNQPAPTPQAQISAEVAVDKSFKTNVGSNGKPNQLFVSLKQWLGSYQQVWKKDARNYTGIFERGALPIEVIFNDDGTVKFFKLGCPTTKSVSLSQAPPDLQKIFLDCPNLK